MQTLLSRLNKIVQKQSQHCQLYLRLHNAKFAIIYYHKKPENRRLHSTGPLFFKEQNQINILRGKIKEKHYILNCRVYFQYKISNKYLPCSATQTQIITFLENYNTTKQPTGLRNSLRIYTQNDSHLSNCQMQHIFDCQCGLCILQQQIAGYKSGFFFRKSTFRQCGFTQFLRYIFGHIFYSISIFLQLAVRIPLLKYINLVASLA
eukprot:TRINITY_DN47746_c0_g2_i3.p2 TRINITY_DN47746_c0_g2~~TRINITY_DN47746_c0_g2_i3.p2  ORF type:complete len:206 (+),score=-23.27 TRINITY_DN47746_c0_g2_i3:941-1558(+)